MLADKIHHLSKPLTSSHGFFFFSFLFDSDQCKEAEHTGTQPASSDAVDNIY